MSQAEILEYCRQSNEFFLANYYHISVVGKGAQLFDMYPHQRHILSEIKDNPLIIGLKARQIGWTTIGVAFALHDVLFNPEHPWLFVSRTEDAAQKMLDKAKYAYYRLPQWMRDRLPKLDSITQSSMVFANGSRIESVPATGSTGRGDSVYGALMDECAFMEYAEEIWGAVEPLISRDGRAMLFSTANGMGNFYHEIWLDSQRDDSVWRGVFFPWQVVPWRDDDWYMRTKLAFRGREWLFYQEYPSSPEEAFAKSGRVAFGSSVLEENFVDAPYAIYDWIIGEGLVPVKDESLAQIPVKVWREPEVVRDPETGRPLWNPNYVIGADIAEGLEHGDLTYVTCFDVNTGEQMFASKSSIPVSYLDDLLNTMGRAYMNALMIPERNNAGILPIDRLYRDHRYPRLYRMDRFGEMLLTDRTPKYGWQTTVATKPKMVNDFLYALTEGHVLLHDPDFLLEAQTFVANGKGSFAATTGNHDDVIMGTLIAWQGVLDSPKYKVVWVDSKVLPPTHDDIDAIAYSDDTLNNADFLEIPMGQKPKERKKMYPLFTEANLRSPMKNTF